MRSAPSLAARARPLVMGALACTAVLPATAIAAEPAPSPGIEELWERYPLDERPVGAGVEPSSGPPADVAPGAFGTADGGGAVVARVSGTVDGASSSGATLIAVAGAMGAVGAGSAAAGTIMFIRRERRA